MKLRIIRIIDGNLYVEKTYNSYHLLYTSKADGFGQVIYRGREHPVSMDIVDRIRKSASHVHSQVGSPNNDRKITQGARVFLRMLILSQ